MSTELSHAAARDQQSPFSQEQTDHHDNRLPALLEAAMQIYKPIGTDSKPSEQHKPGRPTDGNLQAGPGWGDNIPGAGKIPPSPYVFAALTEALKTDLQKDPRWQAINKAQQELLGQSASLGPEVQKLRELGLLDGAAQLGGADKVNAMFARHGIPIHLEGVPADGIAAGGVFDFKADWKGTETKMTAKDKDGTLKEFDAFKKDVKSFNVNGTTVIEVYRDDTKGITMYMAASEAEQKGYDAYKKAFELTPGKNTPAGAYSEAILPKMKVRDEGEVPQLVGLQASGDYKVAQAKIFTSADFDQNGAEIKQGLGVVMLKASIEMPKPVYTMDKPPLVWVVQDGASKPLIAFRVGQESWKDPKKN
jgi:hypothetical protein